MSQEAAPVTSCQEALRQVRDSLNNVLSQVAVKQEEKKDTPKNDEPGEASTSSSSAPAPFDETAFWSKWSAHIVALGKEVNKLGLSFRSVPWPSPEETRSLCQAWEAQHVALLGMFAPLTEERGRLWLGQMTRYTHELFEANVWLADLLIELTAKGEEAGGGGDALLSAVGSVWEKCDGVAGLARHQRDAVRHVLQGERTLVQDAILELEEALAAQQDDEEDDDYEDEDDLNMSWSPAERSLTGPALSLMRAAQAVLKQVALQLKPDPAAGAADPPPAELDPTCDLCRRLSPAVDDLALTLYPPVDRPECTRHAQALKALLLDVLADLDAREWVAHDQKFRSWCQFLDGAVKSKMTELLTKQTEADLGELSVSDSAPSTSKSK